MLGDGFLDDPGDEWNRNHTVARSLGALVVKQCLVVSGEPGLGKSIALEQAFPNINHSAGGDATTFWIRFRDIPDAAIFSKRVFDSARWQTWMSGDGAITLVLDGLDEGLVKIRDFLSFLTAELQSAPIERLRLIMACRTADWPVAAGNKLLSLWNSDVAESFWELCPLRRKDVELAAGFRGVPSEPFLQQVYDKHVVTLAARPTTLFFLLRQFGKTGQLEGTHRDIYSRGILDLCAEPSSERAEALKRGGDGPTRFTAEHLRDGASLLAAMLIFTGRSAISTATAEQASESDFRLDSIASSASSQDRRAATSAITTALFSSRGEHRVGFSHQSFAECLAARRVRNLQLIQLRELFCRMDAGQEHVIPQLAETAAWLAGDNDEFLRHVLRIDPEVLLRSDITRVQAERKSEIVAAIRENRGTRAFRRFWVTPLLIHAAAR